MKIAHSPKMSTDDSLQKSIHEEIFVKAFEIIEETAPMSEEREEQMSKLMEKFQRMIPSGYLEKDSCMYNKMKNNFRSADKSTIPKNKIN